MPARQASLRLHKYCKATLQLPTHSCRMHSRAGEHLLLPQACHTSIVNPSSLAVGRSQPLQCRLVQCRLRRCCAPQGRDLFHRPHVFSFQCRSRAT